MVDNVSRISTGDLTGRIRGYLPELTGANRAIAEHILDDPITVTTCSISELAELAGTSPASITRFCQAIGLAGFAQLRLHAAAEVGTSSSVSWDRDLGSSIGPTDPPERVAAIIAAADMQALQQTAAQLDYTAVRAVAEAIAGAARVDIYGVGGSAISGIELQQRLHRIGRPVWAYADTHQAKMSACLLKAGDVFFGISRSGRTNEVIDVLEEASAQGATTVALTSFANSPLAQMADITLTTPVQDTNARHGSLAAKYAQLLVVDCVYSVVAQLTYEQTAVALATTTQALASHRAVRGGRRSKSVPKALPADGA